MKRRAGKKQRFRNNEEEFSSRFLADFEPVQQLGQGGFGIVFEARDKLVDINYAVKRIPLSSSMPEKEKVMREVRSHARLNHHHIVRYQVTWLEAPPPGWQARADIGLAQKTGASIHDPGWTATYSEYYMENQLTLLGRAITRTEKEEPREFLYIAMELCPHGTLKDWLDRNQTRKQKVVIKLFRQICNGVAYIHSQDVIHRDLKPSNIYLSDSQCIKIGDFGLATNPGSSREESRSDQPAGQLTHLVGTRLYMSPEQRDRRFYDQKVDIFSLGLILLDLIVPFSTDSERYQVLSMAKLGEYPQSLLNDPNHLQWRRLLGSMLHELPAMRPEASQISKFCPKTKKQKNIR